MEEALGAEATEERDVVSLYPDLLFTSPVVGV